MRGPIYYVVQPTAELRRLNEEMGIGHPFAEEVRVWESSEHHRNRKHTPEQIAEATWLAFFGDFDLAHLDKLGVDARPFLKECKRLGFERCFSMFEADSLAPADKLIEDAESDRERARINLAL